MNNELMIFEGQELEVLTKEDLSFDFEGEVLFNGKQICDILNYSNLNRDIDRHCEEEDIFIITKDKLNTKMVTSLELNTKSITLGQRGTKFITDNGVFDLIYNSKLPKAKEFKKKVREIIKQVQQTGKFDAIENKIKQIEDETERNLTMSLYGLEQVLKVNPKDMLTVINYNQTKQELSQYKQKKELIEFKKDFNELEGKIKKTTVLREGDMDAKAVARKFNVFSKTNKPHNQFADKIAKVLGIYQNPRGNAGYQDNYISINLSSVGGTTVAEIKYSQEAVNMMEEYINTNGLEIEEPPKYGARGKNKGRFQQATMIFENGEHIFINEITYKFYSQIVNKGN